MRLNTIKDLENLLKSLEKYSLTFLAVVGVAYLLVTYSVVKDKLESYRKAKEAASLLNKIDPVIKSLEKERGMSAGYLKGAEEFAEKLKKQREKTDEAIKELRNYLNKHPIDNFGRQAVFSVNSFYAYFVNNLPDVRREVDARSIDLLQELSFYTKMIRRLISITYSISSEAGALSSDFIAYGALVTAQDAAGLERALGSVVFAEGKIDLLTYREIIKERDEEVAFIDQFVSIAPPRVVDKFNLVKGDVAFIKVGEIVNALINDVKVASDNATSGNGTVVFISPVINKYTPSEWWDLATKKVDDFVKTSRFALDVIVKKYKSEYVDALTSVAYHVGLFILVMGYVMFMVRQLRAVVAVIEKKY